MKFADNPNQAAECLRQAIPLMVKYSIPPNPLNYSLWYAYVSNVIPGLNTQMDKALETYGTCPSIISEQMFRDFLIKEEIDNAEDLQTALMAVMGSLESEASSTIENAEAFSDMLEDSLQALQASHVIEQDENVAGIIEKLTANTQAMSDTTKQFQSKIDEAQAEIATLKQELEKSRQDASVDALTGLFNRRVFDMEFSQIASSKDAKVTLVMIDIDHFKKFNDTYGHLMGDKVLQYVGKMVKELCLPPLLPVRFGGEEFAVLLPGKDTATAVQLAETIRSKIKAIRIKQKKSGEVISSITSSFGVAELIPGETPDACTGRADVALYKAKQNGRDQVQIAN
ncbi:GGDEF domain-containing protein [Aliamphritea ceti]|uniref:GGDEF domain-containing protein n=1 Tax=Aliamphritea ceti TaxID=1524258 RepID=UPI0021C3457A|nr:GGDEF domain-containing protein [Aliamphritea ceti]